MHRSATGAQSGVADLLQVGHALGETVGFPGWEGNFTPVLEQFFAEKSDSSSRSLLVRKLKDTLDAHFDGPLSLEELLHLLHAECCIVQDSFSEAPEGKAGEHYRAALSHYLEALFLVGRELEASADLTEETENQACQLAARADQCFSDFEFEASQIETAEPEA